MILTNVAILKAIKAGNLAIDGLVGLDPSKSPFNTTAVDLSLGDSISVPNSGPAAFDLRKPGIATYLHDNSKHHALLDSQPYPLAPQQLVLGQTKESVNFPIRPKKPCYCARVEGRSSIARCGILVHFTAPTIHAGFEGKITLEIINLGASDFLLYPGMPICQLIIEEVSGTPLDAPNQFKHQQTPAGTRK